VFVGRASGREFSEDFRLKRVVPALPSFVGRGESFEKATHSLDLSARLMTHHTFAQKGVTNHWKKFGGKVTTGKIRLERRWQGGKPWSWDIHGNKRGESKAPCSEGQIHYWRNRGDFKKKTKKYGKSSNLSVLGTSIAAGTAWTAKPRKVSGTPGKGDRRTAPEGKLKRKKKEKVDKAWKDSRSTANKKEGGGKRNHRGKNEESHLKNEDSPVGEPRIPASRSINGTASAGVLKTQGPRSSSLWYIS